MMSSPLSLDRSDVRLPIEEAAEHLEPFDEDTVAALVGDHDYVLGCYHVGKTTVKQPILWPIRTHVHDQDCGRA